MSLTTDITLNDFTEMDTDKIRRIIKRRELQRQELTDAIEDHVSDNGIHVDIYQLSRWIDRAKKCDMDIMKGENEIAARTETMAECLARTSGYSVAEVVSQCKG